MGYDMAGRQAEVASGVETWVDVVTREKQEEREKSKEEHEGKGHHLNSKSPPNKDKRSEQVVIEKDVKHRNEEEEKGGERDIVSAEKT